MKPTPNQIADLITESPDKDISQLFVFYEEFTQEDLQNAGIDHQQQYGKIFGPGGILSDDWPHDRVYESPNWIQPGTAAIRQHADEIVDAYTAIMQRRSGDQATEISDSEWWESLSDIEKEIKARYEAECLLPARLARAKRQKEADDRKQRLRYEPQFERCQMCGTATDKINTFGTCENCYVKNNQSTVHSPQDFIKSGGVKRTSSRNTNRKPKSTKKLKGGADKSTGGEQFGLNW